MNKKILIIGGNGFLGYNLSKKLKKLDYEILLLCRKKNHKLKNIQGVKYIFCDLNNFIELKKKLSGEFDFVVNLSGNISHNNKLQTLKVHYYGLRNILKILKKKIKVFIQIGSSLEYGRSVSSPQIEKNICDPISFYGKAKYKASKILINNKNLFKYIILRLYQVYGSHQKNNRLIPHVISSCLKDQEFNCSEGNQKRDFLYVDDFTDLVVKILKKKNIKSGIYNVGYGRPIVVREVIKKIQSIIQKGKPIYGGTQMRKDEIVSLYPNITKVHKYFGWKPKINFLNGIKKTIKHYASNKKNFSRTIS